MDTITTSKSSLSENIPPLSAAPAAGPEQQSTFSKEVRDGIDRIILRENQPIPIRESEICDIGRSISSLTEIILGLESPFVWLNNKAFVEDCELILKANTIIYNDLEKCPLEQKPQLESHILVLASIIFSFSCYVQKDQSLQSELFLDFQRVSCTLPLADSSSQSISATLLFRVYRENQLPQFSFFLQPILLKLKKLFDLARREDREVKEFNPFCVYARIALDNLPILLGCYYSTIAEGASFEIPVIIKQTPLFEDISSFLRNFGFIFNEGSCDELDQLRKGFSKTRDFIKRIQNKNPENFDEALTIGGGYLNHTL